MGSLGELEYPVNDSLSNMASNTNPLDPEEFRRQGHMVIDFIADYYKNIEKHPVLSQVEPGYLKKRLPTSAPYYPESIETILSDVQEHIVPGITHWQSPNYFAYFPSSGSIAGFLGEMLATGFNVVGFNWMSSPAATELESIVMDWLGQMLRLPKSFLFSGNGGGVLQGTTCEAILCTLVAARDRTLKKIGNDKIGKLVVYCSDQTHCAFKKAAQIAGIHPNNFRVIPTTLSSSFSMSPEALRKTIMADVDAGFVPIYLLATVGTTSTTAVDPLGPLCDVAKDYGMWVHVDAAYAGSICICPEFRHFIDGMEGASSFSFNAHKWFFTTLDCCCLWVKDPAALTKSLSTDPEYLKNKASESKQVVDYKDWQLALSRRFRSLKLWLVLRSYGVERLRGFLRSHVKMAKQFQAFVLADHRFEVVVPRNFATVCFRISPSALLATRNANKGPHHAVLSEIINISNDNNIGTTTRTISTPPPPPLKMVSVNELNQKLMDSINGSGRAYLTHSVVDGIFLLRFAVGASLTEESHVVQAWNVVKEHADTILSGYTSQSHC
ncbi:Aromatic-L-amino-acid decarboxylase [Trema orientale]|uniref:Aromatic-L-amino-acid decarboxylase n=1 Tax=Trema orientale TaxID=63057 RepID=A0A2P5CGE1_TREOI|nr:Aromatic-L-amino-acid decarboxylase [Trema orientale]